VVTSRWSGPDATGRERFVRVVVTGFVAYAFYLALGDPTDIFDLVTGGISATLVGVVLGGVTFRRTPTAGTIGTLARATAFLPLLIVAVVRANLALARIILDPRLPIEPTVVRIPAPTGTFARALLANSITLTPGTLTLDIVDDELVVHTLTAASRQELLAGSLVRSVAFVTGSDPTGEPETSR
jgi:multicomponent Na+:H+ antiporter subunit E